MIELYGSQIQGDNKQTTLNLCNCDDQVQDDKFKDLTLDRVSIMHRHNYHLKAEFSVFAQDADFIQQVIYEYMDGFEDCFAVALNGYYSRTGYRPGFNPHPMDWNLEVKSNS